MIESWSYSRLKVFEGCPYRAYLQFSEKRPQTMDMTAANRGTMIHDACEKFVIGEGQPTVEMARFAEYFTDLRAKYEDGLVTVEEEWGFNKDWQPTDYWGDDIWCRMKLDNCINNITVNSDVMKMTATDYKSGKKFGNEVSHNQQGQLYVIGTFMRHPAVEVVDVDFRYLDHGLKTVKTYTREKAMKFLPMWTKRAEALTTATSFPPKPNKITCMWCPYGPNKGDGSCEWGVDSS